MLWEGLVTSFNLHAHCCVDFFPVVGGGHREKATPLSFSVSLCPSSTQFQHWSRNCAVVWSGEIQSCFIKWSLNQICFFPHQTAGTVTVTLSWLHHFSGWKNKHHDHGGGWDSSALLQNVNDIISTAFLNVQSGEQESKTNMEDTAGKKKKTSLITEKIHKDLQHVESKNISLPVLLWCNVTNNTSMCMFWIMWCDQRWLLVCCPGHGTMLLEIPLLKL